MSDLRERVIGVVADTLRVDARTVTAAPTLFDLAGFDSLAIVAVLERLEDELGIEVAPERILPDAFTSVETLCDMIAEGVRR